MPSRGWYVVAAVIFFGAVAGAVSILMSGIGGIGTALVQVVVPGSADLELKEAGSYTIFHEHTSQVGGRIFTPVDISGLRVTIRAVADNRQVDVRSPSGRQTYDIGGRSGRSVLAFDIDKPGTYRLTAAYDDGRQQPQAVLAVSGTFVGDLLMTIFMALGVAFAGLVGALVIAIVVLIRRRRGLRQRPA
jgi:hypothetical protein